MEFLFGPDPIVWVQRLLGPGYAILFRPLDVLGTVWGIPFAIGLALWLWGRSDAYALAAIMVPEAVLYLLLQRLFPIPRPHAPSITVYEQIDLPSFPSGHAFTVTVLWGLLWARGRVPFWLTALITLWVGVGRLYLGTHYLGDVLGGIVVGALLVWTFTKLWPPVRNWLARRSPAFLTAAALVVAAGALAAAIFLFGTDYHRWNSAGVVAGLALGFLLEWRWIGYEPRAGSAGGMLLRVIPGALVMIALFLVDRLTGEAAYRVGAGAIFLAALWAVFFAPALFTRLGWSPPGRSDPRRAGADLGRLNPRDSECLRR